MPYFVPKQDKDPFSEQVIANLESEGLIIKWRYGYKLTNRYEVRQVCAGGIGIVWIIEDLLEKNKIYAAKSIKQYFRKPETQDEWTRREESIKRFLEECNVWVDLGKHRHIVCAELLEKIEGVPLVMSEYIEGGDLEGWIKKDKLDISTAVDFAIQFCLGMEYANEKGVVVHRDIKPGNILLTKDGVVKINDWGFAKALESTEEIRGVRELKSRFDFRLISVSRGMGTPLYMAPEQFPEKLLKYYGYPIASVTTKADIYAFGLVLYEMVTGRHPYKANESQDNQRWQDAISLARELHVSPSHIFCLLKSLELKLSCPLSPYKDLDKLILKCLKNNPDERYDSFQEVKQGLLSMYRQAKGREYEVIEEPPYLPNFRNRAKTYWILGREEESLELYDKALEENPGDISSWLEKGFALAETGNLRECRTCLEIIPYLKPSQEYNVNTSRKQMINHTSILPRDKKLLLDFSSTYTVADSIMDFLLKEDIQYPDEVFKEFHPVLAKHMVDLKDERPGIRSHAIWKLVKLGDASCVPLLRELLDDPDINVRTDAKWALWRFEKMDEASIIPVILKKLKDKDDETRYRAIRRLSELGDKSIVPALVDRLGDKFTHVRSVAVRSLGELADKRAIAPLRKRLKKEPEEGIRTSITVALSKLGDNSMIPTLNKLLENDESDYYLLAVEGLALLGDASASAALAKVLTRLESSKKNLEEASMRIIRTLRIIYFAYDDPKITKLKERLHQYSAFEWNSKGSWLAAMKKYQEALICFEKASAIDPGWNEPRQAKIFCLRKLKKLDQLESLNDKGLEMLGKSEEDTDSRYTEAISGAENTYYKFGFAVGEPETPELLARIADSNNVSKRVVCTLIFGLTWVEKETKAYQKLELIHRNRDHVDPIVDLGLISTSRLETNKVLLRDGCASKEYDLDELAAQITAKRAVKILSQIDIAGLQSPQLMPEAYNSAKEKLSDIFSLDDNNVFDELDPVIKQKFISKLILFSERRQNTQQSH